MTWEGRTYEIVDGITGQAEARRTVTQIYGPIREEVAKALEAIAAKFDYTVTSENYRSIIEACASALAELEKTRPVKDERKTPEEDAADNQALNEARERCDRENKAQAKATAAAIEANRGMFPWVERKREGQSDHAWTGCNIRNELALKFPGTKFSVTTEYGSVRVYWELGPTDERVKDVIGKYEMWGYSTDGAPEDEELKQKRIEHRAINTIVGGVRYLSTSRHIPPMTYNEVCKLLCEHLKIEFKSPQQHGTVEGEQPGDELGDYAYRLLRKTDWPAGATIKNIEDDPECPDPRCFWKLILKGAPMPAAASPGPNGAIIRRNLEHDGIEIAFPAKPEPEILARIKGAGFRWSSRSKVWYKKHSLEAWALAHRLLGITEGSAPAGEHPNPAPDRFDQQVEDNMARQCGLM